MDETEMPQKKFYRSRARTLVLHCYYIYDHIKTDCNPLSHNDGFEYPVTPANYDWKEHFPSNPSPVVKHVDIGCGFGGLTVKLSNLYPEVPVVGFEIRAKVCEYVRLRIASLRSQGTGQCENASCVRYLPNYFEKSQLSKMFICFPDPHFKAKNHRRRIISEVLLSEYAYFLEENGKLYTVTDVKELHDWHMEKCLAHPLFQMVASGFRNVDGKSDDFIHSDGDNSGCHVEQVDVDPCILAMLDDTEESKKVARMQGQKYYAVFRRITQTEADALRPPLLNLFP